MGVFDLGLQSFSVWRTTNAAVNPDQVVAVVAIIADGLAAGLHVAVLQLSF
jgi:hypothetical protein